MLLAEKVLDSSQGSVETRFSPCRKCGDTCKFTASSDAEMEPDLRVMGQRFSDFDRVGSGRSRASVTNPMFDPVLSFNVRIVALFLRSSLKHFNKVAILVIRVWSVGGAILNGLGFLTGN